MLGNYSSCVELSQGGLLNPSSGSGLFQAAQRL